MATLTPEQLAPFRIAVHERICAMCNDLGTHGHCARPADDACSLESHLDLIVESILEVGGHAQVDPYVAALRSRTCPNCRQDEAGDCALRDVTQCAPDAYLLPLIEVIEEVAMEQGHGAWAKVTPVADR